MHKDACNPGIEPSEHVEVRLIELCRRRELEGCSSELDGGERVQVKP